MSMSLFTEFISSSIYLIVWFSFSIFLVGAHVCCFPHKFNFHILPSSTTICETIFFSVVFLDMVFLFIQNKIIYMFFMFFLSVFFKYNNNMNTQKSCTTKPTFYFNHLSLALCVYLL